MIVQPYVNFIQPDAGGNVKPVSQGKVYIGKEGLDPLMGGVPIYYRDNQGLEKEIQNPIYLNMTGVAVAGPNNSTIINPYTKEPISILIEDKNGVEVHSKLSYVSRLLTIDDLSEHAKLLYKSSAESSPVDNMISGNPVVANVGDVCTTGGTTWLRTSNSTNDITDFVALTDIHIKDFGLIGDGATDDTPKLELVTKSIRSGQTIDLDGLVIKQTNQGSNFNPFRPNQAKNQTCYMFIEKKDNITIQNGDFVADLDMTHDCLILMGFVGCKGVTLSNVGLTLNATGIPSFSTNGFETFAGLLSFKHHYDDTDGRDLLIKDNCRFKMFHPEGCSIGDKDGNPVHNYSGKLVGIDFYGNVSEAGQPSPDKPIYGLSIKDSFFTNSTARVIWCWGSYDVRIVDNSFVNMGLNSTAFCNYIIRMTHWGRDVIIRGNRVRNGYFGTCGFLVSNNNSPRIPENVNILDNNFDSSEGLHILLNSGYNVNVKGNNFHNVTSPSSIIGCYEQTSSEWKNNIISDNNFYNVTAQSVIYSSADAAYEVSIKRNNIDQTSKYGIYLKFHPQYVEDNKVNASTDVAFYADNAISDFIYYIDNEVTNCLAYAFNSFASSKSVFKDNTIVDCASGIKVTEDSIAEGNYIEGCVTDSLNMRRNSKALRNTVIATDNTTDGTDAIYNSDASTNICIGNTIISDGSFRYGVNVNESIAYKVMHCHFSGTFSASEYRDNGVLVSAFNTNDSGQI
jgi:hypothetical protein